MRTKKMSYFLVIIVVVLIAGAFYWWQYRPSAIRKYCAEHFEDKIIYGKQCKGDNFYGKCIGDNVTENGEFEIVPLGNQYQDCLHKRGL